MSHCWSVVHILFPGTQQLAAKDPGKMFPQRQVSSQVCPPHRLRFPFLFRLLNVCLFLKERDLPADSVSDSGDPHIPPAEGPVWLRDQGPWNLPDGRGARKSNCSLQPAVPVALPPGSVRAQGTCSKTLALWTQLTYSDHWAEG